MTCHHVLGLIDAGPFADYPREHLDAAWAHAQDCPTCGPALAGSTNLTAGLGAISRPTAPPRLAPKIMAAIAPTPSPARAASVEPAALSEGALGTLPNWAPWANALGAFALAVAIGWSWLAGESIITTRGSLWTGFSVRPSTTMGALAMAASLGLYVLGLFGVTNRREERSNESS